MPLFGRVTLFVRHRRAGPTRYSFRVAVVALVAFTLGCVGGGTDPDPGDTTGTPPSPTIPPGPYTPGKSYFGKNDYTEYVAGNAPLIYSAPHGDALTPSDIPDRTAARCGGAARSSRRTSRV